MNFRLEKRYSHGLQFGANYTWSKAIDDVRSRNELGGNAGDNAFGTNMTGRRSRTVGNNIAHRFVGNVTWELPFGIGRRSIVGSGLSKQALGGWSTSLIYEARTGAPFGVMENKRPLSIRPRSAVRSNAVAAYRANPNWRGNVLSETFFNTSCFAAPRSIHFGNTGRTVAIGPGAIVADMSVLEEISGDRSQRLQFRVGGDEFHQSRELRAVQISSRGNANFGRSVACRMAIRRGSSNSGCITSSEESHNHVDHRFVALPFLAIPGAILLAKLEPSSTSSRRRSGRSWSTAAMRAIRPQTKPAGGLRVDDRNGLLTGGNTGPR